MRECIACHWCEKFKGSIEARVVNQHVKTSQSHKQSRQRILYPEKHPNIHQRLLRKNNKGDTHHWRLLPLQWITMLRTSYASWADKFKVRRARKVLGAGSG